MDEFTDILIDASASVSEEYFHLPIDGGESVYRERVYCYELYHQIRARWPNECAYFLNGEVDKHAHPYFLDAGSPKPDYIVHIPGTNENYAVIEVKAAAPPAQEIRNDVQKLVTFKELGYERAIYIIYGSDFEEARDGVTAAVEDSNALAAFELWVHRYAGEPATHVAFALN